MPPGTGGPSTWSYCSGGLQGEIAAFLVGKSYHFTLSMNLLPAVPDQMPHLAVQRSAYSSDFRCLATGILPPRRVDIYSNSCILTIFNSTGRSIGQKVIRTSETRCSAFHAAKGLADKLLSRVCSVSDVGLCDIASFYTQIMMLISLHSIE